MMTRSFYGVALGVLILATGVGFVGGEALGAIWPLYSCDATTPIPCPAQCGGAAGGGVCGACIIASYPCSTGTPNLGTCIFWDEDWSCNNHGCCRGTCTGGGETCGCFTASGNGC